MCPCGHTDLLRMKICQCSGETNSLISKRNLREHVWTDWNGKQSLSLATVNMNCAQCKFRWRTRLSLRGALDLCNICFTTDLNVLSFGCVAQSTLQGMWCSEKPMKNCPREPCYFNKLTNFYTSFVLNIAAMAAWPLERANSA